MQLAHETQRDRQRCEPLQAVLQGGDVVPHLAQIVGAAVDGSAGLGRQQLAEGRLRAFDAAGEDGLLANEGAESAGAGWEDAAPRLQACQWPGRQRTG